MAGRLSPYVAGVTAYDVDLGGPGVHRGLPSTALTLVLALGDPLDVGWAEAPRSRTRRWASVAGLHQGPAAIHHDGHQRGVQVDLTVTGVRALLGMPAGALAGQIVDLVDVCPALRHLPEQLAAAPAASHARIVAEALEGVLARRETGSPRAEVGRALRCLTRGDAVHRVAAEVGYSRRRLSTLVREESGLGPKAYQRVARFQTSRLLMGRRPLASIAATCGYSDQAHLTRDWAELAGCAPTVWLREEFPFLQDLTAADRGR